MVDAVVATETPVAIPAPAAPAAAEVASAPAAVAPVAIAAEAAPTPTPTPPPVATPTPTVDAPTSILSDAVASKPAATTETPPALATPAEVAAPAVPPPPPVYESFKLPEGVQLDATKVTEFTKMLGELETSGKADHAQVQAFGQRAVDFFIAEQQRQQQALVDGFEKIRTDWRTEIKNDPTFGGQNYTKTVADAATVIEQYGGSAEEVAALRQMFRITGAGDNPHMIRMLARLGKAAVREGTPVPATVPKSPQTVPRSQRRYAGSLNGNGAS